MTHKMLLALFVLTGVFTEQELKRFLREKENEQIPYNADWDYFVKEIKEWKERQL